MDEVTVHVEAEINPTESQTRVEKAIQNLFGNISMRKKARHQGELLIGEARGAESLSTLQSLLRRERIRNAARTVLLEGLSSKGIFFCLNKQVAYTGHLSFSKEEAESPLGPIKVRIECTNPRQLINWLTPKIT